MYSKASIKTLILLDMDISNTTPNSQIRDIRLDPIECLIGCLARKSRDMRVVPSVNE
jgi:hypothetical protein